MNHKSIVSGLNVRLLKAALGNSGFWGSFIVVIAILIALLAPQLSPNDPEALDTSIRFMPPSAEHWLGTDHMGRDVMSRLLWGARPSLKIGVGAVIIGLPLGIIVGLLSGFYRNTLIETVLMRTMEVLAAT
ncbi:MAG: hypothetical protein HOE30_12970 [Deltaproteobacteria bacterium]|nr:hypothetical protein [Deltaproteobacteria bacterium]